MEATCQPISVYNRLLLKSTYYKPYYAISLFDAAVEQWE